MEQTLLSPIEFARYVDEFNSRWVRAYFDVGNVVLYGFPQDWIRTLGSRIVKLHVKDFTVDRKSSRYSWVNLGEGDINWPEVRRALDTKFAGYMTTELPGGDAAYLKDVSARVDKILAGSSCLSKARGEDSGAFRTGISARSGGLYPLTSWLPPRDRLNKRYLFDKMTVDFNSRYLLIISACDGNQARSCHSKRRFAPALRSSPARREGIPWIRIGQAARGRFGTAAADHGTPHRALGRLEAMGMLESRWEDPEIPARENRPGRRLHADRGW